MKRSTCWRRRRLRLRWGTIVYGTLGITKALVGDREGALRMIAEMDQLSNKVYVPQIYYAWVYCVLGEMDKAFEWLDRSFEKRDFHLRYVGVSPGLELLRRDPRFPELLKRLRLMEVSSEMTKPMATRVMHQ